MLPVQCLKVQVLSLERLTTIALLHSVTQPDIDAAEQPMLAPEHHHLSVVQHEAGDHEKGKEHVQSVREHSTKAHEHTTKPRAESH